MQRRPLMCVHGIAFFTPGRPLQRKHCLQNIKIKKETEESEFPTELSSFSTNLTKEQDFNTKILKQKRTIS